MGLHAKFILVSLQLYIGEHGSCHKIGVIATGEIAVGECLAVIPREAILSCANSTIATLVREDKELENVSSSWIPLLIALAAESSLKVSENVPACNMYCSCQYCSKLRVLAFYKLLLLIINSQSLHVFDRTRATGTLT